MRRHASRLVLLGLPALALLAAPAMGGEALAGQVATVYPDGAPTGWIGVSVEMRGTVDAGSGERTTRVVISEVRPGGPAARAGLRAGDLLLSINGRAPEEGFAEMVGRLEPGDAVSVTVLRDGEEERFRFRAGSRPAEMAGPSTYQVLVRADTLADRMYRAMDSLRVRIVSREGSQEAPRISTVRVMGRPGEADTVVAVFREGLRDEHRTLRLRAIPSSPDSMEGRPWLATGERRPFRLLFLASDSLLPLPGVEGAAPAPGEWQMAGEDGAGVSLRPLAPYALGQNRAAGAELVELKPALAEYFDVEGGLLVVDVAPGTPAARAGLLPGDVLVRIGAVPVGSLGDLRTSLAQPRDSLAVSLIRKGRRMELLLRR